MTELFSLYFFLFFSFFLFFLFFLSFFFLFFFLFFSFSRTRLLFTCQCAWTPCSFHSLVSRQTFQRALTALVDIKSDPSVTYVTNSSSLEEDAGKWCSECGFVGHVMRAVGCKVSVVKLPFYDVRVYGRLTTITDADCQRVVDNWCFSPRLQDGNSQTSTEKITEFGS